MKSFLQPQQASVITQDDTHVTDWSWFKDTWPLLCFHLDGQQSWQELKARTAEGNMNLWQRGAAENTGLLLNQRSQLISYVSLQVLLACALKSQAHWLIDWTD